MLGYCCIHVQGQGFKGGRGVSRRDWGRCVLCLLKRRGGYSFVCLYGIWDVRVYMRLAVPSGLFRALRGLGLGEPDLPNKRERLDLYICLKLPVMSSHDETRRDEISKDVCDMWSAHYSVLEGKDEQTLERKSLSFPLNYCTPTTRSSRGQ